MENEEEIVGLSLCLSLGSGYHGHTEQPPPSSTTQPPCTLEPSCLSLSLPAATTVKRELPVEELDDDDGATHRAAVYSVASSAVEDDEGCNGRKKLRLTKEQSALLEDRFKEHNAPNHKQKAALAKQLNLRPRQVEVWFQNRRARTKLKQTEVDCELLKRCCETLTEENRRLHRELQQLRALTDHPHHAAFFMPAAALSVCPSCERLAAAPAATVVADRTSKATGPGRMFSSAFTKSAAC